MENCKRHTSSHHKLGLKFNLAEWIRIYDVFCLGNHIMQGNPLHSKLIYSWWFDKPFEKYANRQIRSFRQGSGPEIQKCLKPRPRTYLGDALQSNHFRWFIEYPPLGDLHAGTSQALWTCRDKLKSSWIGSGAKADILNRENIENVESKMSHCNMCELPCVCVLAILFPSLALRCWASLSLDMLIYRYVFVHFCLLLLQAFFSQKLCRLMCLFLDIMPPHNSPVEATEMWNDVEFAKTKAPWHHHDNTSHMWM